MQALILAAGYGRRMWPLTAQTPKPMLKVAGKPLLEHHVERLAHCAITRLVINHAYLGAQITDYFGDGSRWGVAIRYSAEGERPLGAAGGVRRALPLLAAEPFLLLSADVWSDYPLDRLVLPERRHAHLVLVPNPVHHPQGDFALRQGQVVPDGTLRYTYSGIGVYHPRLFEGTEAEFAPLLRTTAVTGKLTGELYRGLWLEANTPDRLQLMRRTAQP